MIGHRLPENRRAWQDAGPYRYFRHVILPIRKLVAHLRGDLIYRQSKYGHRIELVFADITQRFPAAGERPAEELTHGVAFVLAAMDHFGLTMEDNRSEIHRVIDRASSRLPSELESVHMRLAAHGQA